MSITGGREYRKCGKEKSGRKEKGTAEKKEGGWRDRSAVSGMRGRAKDEEEKERKMVQMPQRSLGSLQNVCIQRVRCVKKEYEALRDTDVQKA